MHFRWALFLLGIAAIFPLLCFAANKPTGNRSPSIFVITNDDNTLLNNTSFYLAGENQQGPALALQNVLGISGRGIGGGFFGTPRVVLLY